MGERAYFVVAVVGILMTKKLKNLSVTGQFSCLK